MADEKYPLPEIGDTESIDGEESKSRQDDDAEETNRDLEDNKASNNISVKNEKVNASPEEIKEASSVSGENNDDKEISMDNINKPQLKEIKQKFSEMMKQHSMSLLFILALSQPNYKHFALHDISKAFFVTKSDEENKNENLQLHNSFSQCIQGVHFLSSQRDLDFYSITDKDLLPLHRILPKP